MEPSEEPAKDLDENDVSNLEKSPEVFDDDEIEPLVIDDNSELGIIHKLRKHLYSTKLNLTSKFLKLGFFIKTKKNLFQQYNLTKFSCCSLKIFNTLRIKEEEK